MSKLTSAVGTKLTTALGLTPMEKFSLSFTLVVLVVLVILAITGSAIGADIVIAVSCGGIGGLVHELFQSGGKIAFFSKRDDGLYLGSLSGVLLGAVAGILVVNAAAERNLIVETFTAGLSLKGIAEAASGNISRKATQNIDRIQGLLQSKVIQPGNIDHLLEE